MFYEIAADLVAIVHLAWVVFLITGALLGRVYRWIRVFHLGGLGFALLLLLMGWRCPLTYLEVWLRRMHDPQGGYPGSFIINYTRKFLGIELSAGMLLTATIAILTISACLYLLPKRR